MCLPTRFCLRPFLVVSYGLPVLQNDVYKYPDIYVCTYDFYGCDDESLLENCTRSAQSTEGGNSTAVFNPTMDDRQELEVGVVHTGQVITACFSLFTPVVSGYRLSLMN